MFFRKSSKNKKENSALNKDFLISEKKLISARIQVAMHKYYETPTEDNLVGVFQELIYGVVYNINLHIPMEITNNNMCYAIERIPEKGYVYLACTTPEELIKCKNYDSSAVVSMRNFFKMVAGDTLAGLALDLCHESASSAIIFLSCENIEAILNYATEVINAQPNEVKEFLKNEI